MLNIKIKIKLTNVYRKLGTDSDIQNKLVVTSWKRERGGAR